METATARYTYLSRDVSVVEGKPRFTGFQPTDERTAALTAEKGPIEDGRPLVFTMDEMSLRQRDNWPGEIGHFNIRSTGILVSSAVKEFLAPRRMEGIMFVPAVLRDIYGNYLEPFFCMHIWQSRNVTDFGGSEYLVPFNPQRDRGHRLISIRLDTAAILALHEKQSEIIRPARVIPRAILFTKDLVSELAAEGLTTGATFYPLEEWFEGMEYQ